VNFINWGNIPFSVAYFTLPILKNKLNYYLSLAILLLEIHKKKEIENEN